VRCARIQREARPKINDPRAEAGNVSDEMTGIKSWPKTCVMGVGKTGAVSSTVPVSARAEWGRARRSHPGAGFFFFFFFFFFLFYPRRTGREAWCKHKTRQAEQQILSVLEAAQDIRLVRVTLCMHLSARPKVNPEGRNGGQHARKTR
jgi:hypothetical protein